MNPPDDSWLRSAHEHAELLDREIKKLVILTGTIRENKPVITKYQDFWNQAKHITVLFKELKPLARCDRDQLWKQFNLLCLDVKEKQKGEYGILESRSKEHFDEIMRFAELAKLPPGPPVQGVHELVERGQALKKASDLLGTYKNEMIARHKKASFDRIQETRKTHNAAWGVVTAEKSRQTQESEFRIRKNIETNCERRRKALNALENFQIGRDHILAFLGSCTDPEKLPLARARLEETEARIKDIEEGIRQLDQWIGEDERRIQD